MGRKITHVIFLLFSVIGSVFLLAGCDSGRKDAEKRIEGEAEKGAPVERELDYDALRERLRPSILQIICGDYRGSGVVWEITEEEVTVVGSGHLLRNGDTCRVLCYAGVYYEAEVVRVLEDCDIGFAVFPAEALQEDGIELAAVVPSAREKEELTKGEELIVYGSMDFVAQNFVEGYLLEAESGIQIEEYDGEASLLLGGIVGGEKKEAEAGEKGAVDAGMSGSGVFDRRGELLGVLAGGDGESFFAAVPVWGIRY